MDATVETTADDWGPFGRPLFNDPEVRRLKRVGVVDVGSNSVRLVIFDGAARSPAYFYNEKILCGLGSGLSETGKLNPEGKQRALAAIRRFQTIANGMKMAPLSAVATAAVREADDGPAFREQVFQETGLRLFVIDGSEEARLSAQGVLLGWPWADGMVCDIGGSSMELAMVHDGKVGKRETSDLGPLKLRDLSGGKKAVRAYVHNKLEELKTKMGDIPPRLYLVGGSWRAIAKLDMERRGYPLRVLHEYEMKPQNLRDTLRWIELTEDLGPLRTAAGISAERMALVPQAAQVLSGVLKVLKPKNIYVSSYGLREGLLYEEMPKKLRARDPLMEACQFAEAKDARVPGFGKALYSFVKPLFPKADANKTRLIRAACLLHDVSWRSHPDFRAEMCFDYATRANLGGLSHTGRVYLGLALMHRYKNARIPSFDPLASMLSEKEIDEAQILGRAMRFGGMFTAQKSDHMGTLKWLPKKSRLILSMDTHIAPLFGEVAQARFASLAKAMEAETEVVLLKPDA